MRWIIGIVLLPLLAIGAWYAYQTYAPTGAVEPFVKEGNLIRNNPGLDAGAWYLSYEESGSPARLAQLAFTRRSTCGRDGVYTVCDMSFEQGERVRVEGLRTRDLVEVTRLTSLQEGESPEPNEEGTRIKLYYYNPALDQGQGGVQCSAKGLVAVERIIPKTTMPLTEAIHLLLRGEISDEERANGVTSEFPLEGVELEKAIVENGVATLTFKDPLNKTGGGSCRASILAHQIEATAKQFPTVQSVRLMPAELFQP